MGEYAEERLAFEHPEVFGDGGFRRSSRAPRVKEHQVTSTAVVALPASGDRSTWSEQEAALVEAAGLTRVVNKQTGEKALADRPTVEAFLQHCRRTGLDPIARQIYAIYRAGKWGIQISIDGARLVAERSGDYEGQTAPEWSDDGRTWYDAWITGDEEEAHPRFARVGVYRRGFREALKVVARWESYAVYDDVWVDGRKTGEKKLSAMWKKMPDLMLAKVAEMLALRKAFPQDLSGLYSTEEMQQASASSSVHPLDSRAVVRPEIPGEDEYGPAAAPEAEPFAKVNWAARIVDSQSVDDLRRVHSDASNAGELGMLIDPQFQTHIDGMLSLFGLPKPDGPIRVGVAIAAVKPVLERLAAVQAAEETVDAEVVEDAPAETVEWPTVEPGSGGRTADPDSGVAFR